ncbi:fibronectin type III domain-containing protein, partial [candidate division WOR-3 bacterium]|nr:fibronectin type III domain-containing protein [candidate division WOR-3 bacterium]
MRKLFFVIRVAVVSCFLSFMGTEAIQVTFLVTVPFETTTADTVYIMGSEPELGNWDPDEVSLSKNPDGSWQIELDLPQKTIFYHYTKGSWFYIEKGPVGEAVDVRSYTVPGSDVIVYDTVYKWGQFGPYLSWVNDPKTTMVVSWRTEDSGDFTVEYGFDTTYEFSVSDATVGTLHSFELTGLNPSTTYHYKVSSSSGEMSVDNTFSTAIYQYEPFTFVAYGDTRTNDGDRAA